MAYSVLKPNSSWFTPTVSTIKRTTITSINIVDSYTPATTPTDSWDASVAQNGGIMCYVEGTALTIAGNGSGKIMANEDSSYVFCDINKSDMFVNVTTMTGLEYIDTSNATTFERMFGKMEKVVSLDLNSWNTKNVKTMSLMFSCAYALSELNIDKWNVSNVENLYGIFDRLTGMTSINVANWDTSSCTDMSYLCNGCTILQSIDLSNWDTSKVTTFHAMFQNCKVLSNLDVSNWDTSKVIDMAFMMYSCDGLTYLATENWDVSNVEKFDHTFAHCNNITFDVSNWKVSNKCKYFGAMFHSNAHKYLDVSGFDTSGAISMFSMFEANKVLEKIDGLQNFDTSNSHSFEQMFSGCYALKELDLSSWDTRKADNDTKARSDQSAYLSQCTQHMFNGCRSLEKITLGENFTFAGDGTAAATYHGTLPTPSSTYIDGATGSWYGADGIVYTAANVPNLTTNIYYAYPISVLMKGSDFCATIPSAAKSVIFTETAPPETATLTNVGAGGNSSIVAWLDGTTYYVYCQDTDKYFANIDCSYMFSGKTALTSIDTGNLNTSNTINMEYMFGNTAAMKLASIIFGSKFNTSNVANMLGMFRFCSSLTTLDVTGFNTSSCTTMERMFDRCEKLQAVDCSNFDTSKVTSTYLMFQVNYELTSVGDTSNWDLSNCTSTRGMFNYCQKLNSLNVSNWNMGKVTDMTNMFQLCELVPELDVSKWDTSSCTNTSFMFYGCKGLTEIAVDNWDVSKVTSFDHMFAHNSNLVNLNTLKWNVTSACTNMNAMFHSVKHTYVNVTGWDTRNVIAFAQMFEANSNLERIDGLNTLNTASCHSFDQMFSGCKKIKELDLSSFDTRTADVGYPTSTNGSTSGCTQNMFKNCQSLEKIILGENFTFIGNGTAPVEAYGSLPTPSATYINGADGNWHTEDGSTYAPADIPNLTYMVYYASPTLVAAVIWDRDSKKYIHLAAMRQYHGMLNAKINTLKEELGDIEEISSEEIRALFSINV